MSDPKLDVAALRALLDGDGPMTSDERNEVYRQALPALLNAVEGAGGLVFGPRYDGQRHAIAADGALYSVLCDTAGYYFECDFMGTDCLPNLTVEQAIESARAHDRARRGAK